MKQHLELWTSKETQVEIVIPAIGSDQGILLNIPISSTKISILRQNSDKNHCRFRINHSQLEKNHDSQDIHDLSPWNVHSSSYQLHQEWVSIRD